MEVLTEFLQINRYYGGGYGSGYDSGYGRGYGDGYGSGAGYGDGDGAGEGYGPGHGSVDGTGDGSGYGDGAGGDVDGYGSGSGDCSGIKSIGKQLVHYIDGVPTLIKYVRNDVAKGNILRHDFTFAPCFVVKSNGFFAHGETLKGAMSALQKKIFEGMSESERIDAFISEFPTLETMVKNEALFEWHHKLTGSCEMGRKQFVADREIDLNSEMTISEFISLTKDSYGHEVIVQLKNRYLEVEQ